MLQSLKRFLWIGLLAVAMQASWAYSLLGPVGNDGDSWQTAQDGFNPIGPANPYLFTDDLPVAPKNIGEEYRRNTPVMYYSFDDNFVGYFGASGTNAVAGAFAILNNLTNVDNYSDALTEFPLQSLGINYQAAALGMYDLKSLTLSQLTEQLGLADAVRYTWVLHARWHVGTPPCPTGENYLVTERNFDVLTSPLNQLQYSPYVNGSLFTYYIYEDCGASPPSPLDGAAVPLPVDPLSDNTPVSSGIGMGYLPLGGFYTGLTRDDVAGLRYLLRAGNLNTESPAAGSQVQATSLGGQTSLYTSDLSSLISSAVTNSPGVLATNFPGLIVASSTYYVTNIPVPNVVTYATNYYGEAYSTPPHIVTVTNGYINNIVTNYLTTFANVITNSFRSSSSSQLITVTVGPQIGYPADAPFVTNTTIQTIVNNNLPSGDYYLLPAGTCGWNILSVLATNVTVTTNFLISATNNVVATNSNRGSVSQTLVSSFTNHVFLVQPVFCPYVNPPVGKYEGIENIKFIQIDQNQLDPLTHQFITPITNNYVMSLYSNGVVIVQNFQRVLTTPDFLFTATDFITVGGGESLIRRTTPNFNTANILTGLAGPGTIDPGTTITFNKSGPAYLNLAPSLLNGPNYGFTYYYGSFDGTTNAPVIYPNGTSIAALENTVFIQISPNSLPAAAVGSPYSATFTVTGGTPGYTWSVPTNTVALPNGLTLSSGGVLSGTPTQNGVFDFVVQVADSASHVVQRNYSITIQ